MLTIFLFFALLVLVFGFVIQERRHYNTYLTPFTLFSVPYLVIIIYQLFVTEIYGWYPVSPIYLFYIILYLVSFYLAGTFFISFLSSINGAVKSPAKDESTTITIKPTKKSYKLLKIIFLFSAIYLILFFLSNLGHLSTIGNMVQEEFQNYYSSGINFFLRLICMIGTVYFWGLMNKKRKSFFFLGLICFIPNFLTFVKGTTFITVLGSIIANILIHKRKFKLKTIILSGLSGVAILFAAYMVEIGIWNPDRLSQKETYEYIFAKLNVYLLAGVQSFNINISSYPEVFQNLPNVVLAPIINLFTKFGLTERIDSVNPVLTNIGFIPNFGSVDVNTNTYIGTIILYCGPILGLLVNITISMIIYYLFYSAIKTNNNINIIRYSLMVTGLVLAWFEYYYLHSFWVYLLILFMFVKIINKYRITK